MRLKAMAALIAAATPAALSAAPIGRFDLAYPFPSPDGRSVVFQSNLDGRWQLYLLNLEDQVIRRLHLSERDDTHPAFSPDGKSVAFISNRTGNDEVHLLDIASGAVRMVAPHPGKDGHPKWSRDGQWLTFNRTFDPADNGGDGDSAIMRVRPDGRDLSVIADSPRVETFPSFSPDGQSVAFVEWFPNAAGERNRNGELVVVDIATKQRRQLTRSDGFDGYPFWGQSGNWIYFSTPVQNESGGREFAVHRIRPNGGSLTRLTDIDGRSEVRAIPSADERTLYYNIPVDGRTLVYSIPVAP